MKKIKETTLDKAFSTWIRNRDGWKCGYCGINIPPPTNMIQCSHFYTRTARSVRWDPENCDAMCAKHHQFLEGRKNAEYTWWKKQQMGEEAFEALRKRYVTLKQWKEIEKQDLLAKYKYKN